MELSEYLSVGHGRAAKLADNLKVARSRISEWANKKAPIPLRYMAPIETFTGKQVTRQEMCPDDWKNIWPELVVAHIQHAQPAIETVAEAQSAIKHVEAAAVEAIRREAGQATTEIKHVAEELLKEPEPWDHVSERRATEQPWDHVSERRKLNAPLDRRVSVESVARAEFLRTQAAAKDQNATGEGA